MKRVAVLVVTALLLVAWSAAPALAHGAGGPADATNYRSVIQGVVRLALDGDEPTGEADVPDGVRWRVLAGDSQLQVTNGGGEELLVEGYEGEPYLRIGMDGVYENASSPAVYLNNDRYAQTPVPAEVDADAAPDWMRVADGPTYRWHDHRAHWMARALPPQVSVAPDQEAVVQEWVVPFQVGGRRLGLDGQLRWIPGPSWWPWLVVGLVVTSTPALIAFRRPAEEGRRRALLRAGAAVVLGVALLDLVHAVDDLFAVPATTAENSLAALQSGLFLLIAVVAAVKGWRGSGGAATAIAVGGAALVGGFGFSHLATLTASQVATALTPELSRFVVGVNVALIVAVALVAWRAQEPASVDPDPVGAGQVA